MLELELSEKELEQKFTLKSVKGPIIIPRERGSTFQFGAPERVETEANEQAIYMYRKLMGSS